MIKSAGLQSRINHLAILKETADKEKAEQLQCSPGPPLITVERVRTSSRRAVVYSLDTLTEAITKRSDLDPELLRTETIYKTSPGHIIEYGISRLLPVSG